MRGDCRSYIHYNTKKGLSSRQTHKPFKHLKLKRNTLAGKPYYVGF
nr:MAG TPA: hypothetical protein [Caudoviricetes sp.]